MGHLPNDEEDGLDWTFLGGGLDWFEFLKQFMAVRQGKRCVSGIRKGLLGAKKLLFSSEKLIPQERVSKLKIISEIDLFN